MAKDKRVEGVVERWGPRFISNGVPLVDMDEALKKIDRWEDW